MTSVVDASVFVSALVDPGPEGQWSEIAMISDDLAGPELALAEAWNLLRRLEQSSLITRSEADRLHEQLLRVEIRLFGYGPYAERIWQLRSNVTCYDAWYVALAEDLNCPLMTLDLRLSRSTGPSCEFVTPPPSITTTDGKKWTLSNSSWLPGHAVDSFVTSPPTKRFPTRN